jgi:sarcosine oxidase
LGEATHKLGSVECSRASFLADPVLLVNPFSVSPLAFDSAKLASACRSGIVRSVRQSGLFMNPVYDVIVLGLGGMGSAAAHQLAARGLRVLGLEQFTPAHDQGSSHGQSRVIRQAYYEDPAYVPLLLRTYDLWQQLERDSGKQLLTITGALMLGAPESGVVKGSLRSAREHNLTHELLDAAEICKRFPPFAPAPDTVGLFEKQGGFVRPEEAVRAHLKLAKQSGATLHFEEEVTDWKTSGSGVRVTTARGVYEAGQLVIAAGPWLGKVLADLELPLRVERQVQFWFEPACGIEPFHPSNFPVWIWETSDGTHPYGLPATDGVGGGVKVSMHHGGKNPVCTPDTIDRTISDEEIAMARRCISARVPALNGRCVKSVACMYTNTPDGHFLIDRHPSRPQVLMVSPCSGHGFKFCPVVGEIVADLVERGETQHNLLPFRWERLAK